MSNPYRHFCVEHEAAVSVRFVKLLSFWAMPRITDDVELADNGSHDVSLPAAAKCSETGPTASLTTHQPAIHATTRYVTVVLRIDTRVPFGIARWASRRSPEMFAPARIPVAAGKKMAKTEKNV